MIKLNKVHVIMNMSVKKLSKFGHQEQSAKRKAVGYD